MIGTRECAGFTTKYDGKIESNMSLLCNCYLDASIRTQHQVYTVGIARMHCIFIDFFPLRFYNLEITFSGFQNKY